MKPRYALLGISALMLFFCHLRPEDAQLHGLTNVILTVAWVLSAIAALICFAAACANIHDAAKADSGFYEDLHCEYSGHNFVSCLKWAVVAALIFIPTHYLL